MKEWLKHFGISFFSHNTASTAPKHGFVSIALSLLLSFLFFLLGYYGSDVVPFSTHYGNATGYREFTQSAFEKADATLVGGRLTTEVRINTYAYDADKREYSRNGYELIVDTRASNTPIEFEQYAEKNGARIELEDYKQLSDADKSGYTVKTEYTDRAAEHTAAAVQKYTAYLDGLAESDEGGAAAQDYAALEAQRPGLAEAEYNAELYALYVANYYENATSILNGARVPVLRDYYYRNYISAGKARYLYVFDDMCAGSFETDGKVPVVFGGYFNKRPDGKVTDIHKLITDVYYDTVGYTFTSYFVSAMTLLPALILVPMAVGLLMWCVGKAAKDKWEKTFAGCYKTVHSFVWVSALIASLLTFVLGFFVSARRLYPLLPVMYGAILLLRTAIHCIICTVKKNKELVEKYGGDNDKKTEEIFGGVL